MTTAGSPVGIAETAKATAATITVLRARSRERFRSTEISTATPAITRICVVSFASCRVSGVSTSSWACSIPEMWPTSVDIPVAVTTNSPAPRVTDVFMKTMSVRSPSGVSSLVSVSTPFETGRLSPVSADSATSSVAAAVSRPSAGTRSPASTRTMSPGTSSSAASSASAPSRSTRALTIIIFWSAATAAAAFPSCCSPRTALKTVRKSRTSPVPSSFSG